MSPNIVIIRDGNGYRLMHGHLRLANMLHATNEILLDIKGEGQIRVMKTRDGYQIGKDGQRLTLKRN
jgi:hypothetical protein